LIRVECEIAADVPPRLGQLERSLPKHMMGILVLLLSIIALVVSLVSVWFVSVMVKRANALSKQFYQGNVRGSIKLMEDLTKSTEVALRTVERLEKVEKKDIESTVPSRIKVLEEATREIRATIGQLEKKLSGSPNQMFS